MHIKIFSNIQDIEPYMTQKLYQGTSLSSLQADCPDYHIVVEQNEVVARCSVWYHNTIKGNNGESIGVIGHFEALYEAGADAVLKQACQLLKEQGCCAIIGPMNQNTWKKYRFVTASNGAPPFMLEPQNPPEYPHYFKQAGFFEYATYLSAIEKKFDEQPQKCDEILLSLQQNDIRIETLDMARFDEQLEMIYELSLDCFQQNLFYTPLEKESFLQQYLSIKNYLIPELIFFAFHKEKPIGFFFAIPDYNQKAYQENVDTVLFKTIGVLPEYRQNKIGSAFIELAKTKAKQLGFQKVIYALIYSENVSQKLTSEATSFRTYTLFRKEIKE